MNKDDFQHFVCIVASEKPFELLEKYKKGKRGEKHIVYRFKDREQIKAKFVKFYEEMSKADAYSEKVREYYGDVSKEIAAMDVNEFFEGMCEDNGFLMDEETGDAYTYENPDGKFRGVELGKFFSLPFKLKDGTLAYQARKGDVDWSLMHLSGSHVYEVVWELVMEGRKPVDDEETRLYENMKNRKYYFEKFGTKERYVLFNTAFWGYAFLSDSQPWVQLEDDMDQFDWVRDYYVKYIEPLPDDTLLTVMECTA